MPTPSKHSKRTTISRVSSRKSTPKHKKTASIDAGTIKVRSSIHTSPLRKAHTAQDKRKKEQIRAIERKIREVKKLITSSTVAKKTQALTKKLHALQEQLTKQKHAFMPGKIAHALMKKIDKQKLSKPLHLVKEIPIKVKEHYSKVKQWEKEVKKHLQHSLTLAHKVDEMHKSGKDKHAIHSVEQKMTTHLDKALDSRNKAIHTAKSNDLLSHPQCSIKKAHHK